MASSVLRQTIHSAVAKTMLNEIGTRAVKYYFSYGRTYDWGGINVQEALDTLPYELAARKNTVFLKEVTPGDAALVIPRYNWVSGATYDPYDAYSNDNIAFSGAKSLEEAIFYVLTDELNVYKCINNNNNSASTAKPTGTSTTEITTPDGYVWKYMYSIPTALGNKFLSTTLMPVANAVTKMFYSDGKLERFILESKGGGYIPNVTQNGTVSSGIALANTNYRLIYGVNTNFLGKSRTVVSYTSTGTNVINATLQSTPLTVTNFIGNGTRIVIATVSSTAALSKEDYIYISGAAAQQILTITNVSANGSQNVVLTTTNTITSLQVGDSITITGATGGQQSKLNGTWAITALDTVNKKISLTVNSAVNTGEYTTGLGTTYLATRVPLNGTWRIADILSGTTFSFLIGDNSTLASGVYKSGIGTTGYASKYDLIRVGDRITIAGAVGTEESKLNGTWTLTGVTSLINLTFSVTGAVAADTYTTSIGTLKHSSKIDGLNANDYIEINGEVRQIDSIQSDTLLTLKSTGPLLYVGDSTTITKLNTYLEIDQGDGYREDNPFVVSSISVTSGGTGYTTNTGPNPYNTTVQFSSPQLPNGRPATATAIVSGGAVTSVTLTDPGYGYTSAPTATIIDNTPGGTGSNAALSVNVVKSKAYLEPVINIETGEITSVVPKYTGTGYTFGVININRFNSMALPTYLTSWPNATVSIDFNIGKVDSKQADVELSAINGGIHFIKVTRAGVGYTAGATVAITGDGTGCTAVPGYDINGVLNRIIITNPGKEYTDATVTITPNEGSAPSTVALARAVISPPGGHGKSSIDELFGRTLSLFNRLTVDTKIKSMSLGDVNYRQLCLFRQPTVFGTPNLYNGSVGSTVYKVVVTVATGAQALSTIPLNTIIKASQGISGSTQIRFRLIARTTNEMLLQAIDNNDEQLTTQLVIVHPDNVTTYTINAIQKPDVEKLSGEVIYIDNRQEFKPLEDQTVSISSRFRF